MPEKPTKSPIKSVEKNSSGVRTSVVATDDRRRSQRVMMRVAVVIEFTLNGKAVSLTAHTVAVNIHGAMICAAQNIPADTVLELEHKMTKERIAGRVTRQAQEFARWILRFLLNLPRHPAISGGYRISSVRIGNRSSGLKGEAARLLPAVIGRILVTVPPSVEFPHFRSAPLALKSNQYYSYGTDFPCFRGVLVMRVRVSVTESGNLLLSI